MKIKIRPENQGDHDAVFSLIEKAFQPMQMSDHREQFLVERLRKSNAFIPSLSLVAETDDRVVGYILLTKLKIENEHDVFDSLALAPVAVLPTYQGRGIGGMLIKQAHDEARKIGHKSVVLLGHADYYPRFGYKQADQFGIKLPFDVPKENCMVIELVENGLKGVSGTVVYPDEFNL